MHLRGREGLTRWRPDVLFRRRTALPTVLAVLLALIGAVQVTSTAKARAATPVLLSQNQPATASSVQSADFPASDAVDGNPGTRWSSAYSDP